MPSLLNQGILHYQLPEQLLIFTSQTLEVMEQGRFFLIISLLQHSFKALL